jgi:protein-arginine kinase
MPFQGYTLSNGMQAGVLRPHLGVGFTCGDEECFELFKDIINPIVQGWHGFDPSTQTHASDLDYAKLVFTDEDAALFAKYVKSTRVRAARNISGFSLPAGSSKEDRLAVEEVLKTAFSNLPDNLKGTYYPLGELTSEQEDELQAGGFLFQKPGPMQLLGAAGAGRNWPEGRGIFHNPDKTVLCWCNEEDQCRIIAMENGGDVKGVFTRFCQLSNAIKAAAESTGRTLMEHPNYGFLGTCPSNLGTGLRGSVMIVLPELNKDPHKLEEICAGFDLQPRGSSGEHSAAVGGKWDISNKQRIGFSEVQLVQKMIDGVKKIIAIEEELAANGGSDAAPAAEAEELAKKPGDSDAASAAEFQAENRALKVDNNDLREKLLSYADILERMQIQFSALQNAYEELKQQAVGASAKEVVKEVIKEVPVEKIVTVIKEVPVEKIVTVIKEVPVIRVEYRDREVVKEVPKIEYRSAAYPFTWAFDVCVVGSAGCFLARWVALIVDVSPRVQIRGVAQERPQASRGTEGRAQTRTSHPGSTSLRSSIL